MFSVLLEGYRIFIKYWKFFTLLVLVSVGVATVVVNSLEIKYEANYIAAPYFETATDATLKLKEVAAAINDNNKEYISKNLSDSLDPNDFTNASVKKMQTNIDISMKHVKVKFMVDVINPNNLDQWDRAIKRQFHLANQLPGNYYRSREINMERMKAIMKDRYEYDISEANDSDDVLTVLKYYNKKDSLSINDSNMIDLLFAKYKVEYFNSLKVNTITNFNSSYHEKEEQFEKPTIFLSMSFLPLFIILFVLIAYVNDNPK